MSDSVELEPREAMEFDVVIVGGGPSGLSAAIKLKQIDPEINVVVLEKGAEIGAHILSGAVVDPVGVDRLFPDWREEEGHPFTVPVKTDKFFVLGPAGKLPLPTSLMPKLMNNHGNYIVSVGNICRWLAGKAEEMGIEVFPGFAASELVLNDAGAVVGVATGDMGVQRDGTPGPNFERGVELHGKYVLIGEGARGSLAKELIAKFNLGENSDPQKFGLGFKELWEIDPAKHKEGTVVHTLGWPLDSNQDGGSFIYHLDNNQVYVGYVVALGYKNPYLSPFDTFQKFKTHTSVAPLLEGGKRISYGARAITQGGFQSVPKLSFPGGAIMGCSAGFVNVPRIKGTHNAMLSGILAAEHVAEALKAGREHDELSSYENAWRESDIGKDLKPVRNVKPLVTRFGTVIGTLISGAEMWCNTLLRNWSPLGTMKHQKADYEATEPADQHEPIHYDKPDGKLTFDKSSSVFLSNTNHEEDQPKHLKLLDPELQKNSEFMKFAGLSRYYCPVGVYEWVDDKGDAADEKDPNASYVINAQNCVHCKTCDIKDPNQNIKWVPPQGGEGPVYPNM
ncbi:electron transfer flavoprotein-ubiquinone oxidoreductase [Ahrensia sp. R2A130]|uniref:electron transfer flavoprotein-ubiquinone oxidoreductase n=1 Tax=Ahrensia sp. R2A130 TaxID=744979 RepID=UPI0001E0F897|nr:electron transfer flavoprotein-ubiquinone oxidoreductase [Ahrensia sp. R2A130]EFL89028.1 electron-transferring-flavoprotein dehydrogenase [Ahrensia sp. R2A130]